MIDRQLRSTLNALPCLGDKLDVYLPAQTDEKHLLQELSNTPAPADWLVSNAIEASARIWVHQTIKRLVHTIDSLRVGMKAGLAPQLQTEIEELSYLVQLLDQPNLSFDSLETSPLNLTDEEMSNLVEQLRGLVIDNQAPTGQWAILHDLLRQTQNSPPIAWLTAQYPQAMAHAALMYLTEQVTPSLAVWEMAPMKDIQPIQMTTTVADIPFTLEEIIHHTDAFSILLTYRLRDSQLSHPTDAQRVNLICEATITDDASNCYVPAYFLCEYTKQWMGRVNYRLRILCFPKLQRPAFTLTLHTPSLTAIHIQTNLPDVYHHLDVPTIQFTVSNQ